MDKGVWSEPQYPADVGGFDSGENSSDCLGKLTQAWHCLLCDDCYLSYTSYLTWVGPKSSWRVTQYRPATNISTLSSPTERNELVRVENEDSRFAPPPRYTPPSKTNEDYSQLNLVCRQTPPPCVEPGWASPQSPGVVRGKPSTSVSSYRTSPGQLISPSRLSGINLWSVKLSLLSTSPLRRVSSPWAWRPTSSICTTSTSPVMTTFTPRVICTRWVVRSETALL